MNPQGKTLAAEAMDQVSYELSVIIQNGWCGRPPNSYGPGTPLAQLWSQSFPNVRFIPNGVMALVSALHSDNFFRNCARAFQLTVGMFATGGAIQTVLDLYYWLQPCQMQKMAAVKFAKFWPRTPELPDVPK